MKNPINILEKLNIPIAYYKFDDEVATPFIIYRGAGSANFKADNKVYNSSYNYTLEYYFKEKNEHLERKIERLLNDNEIIWEKTEDVYIPSENMFLIYYNLGGK